MTRYEAYEKLQTPQKRLLCMKKNVCLTDHPIGYGNENKGIENKQGRLWKEEKQENFPCALLRIQFTFKAILGAA